MELNQNLMKNIKNKTGQTHGPICLALVEEG